MLVRMTEVIHTFPLQPWAIPFLNAFARVKQSQVLSLGFCTGREFGMLLLINFSYEDQVLALIAWVANKGFVENQ